MEHRVRATVDIWIARIGTVFGWFWCVLYTLAAIVGFCEMPDAKDNLDRVMPFICLALAALHYLLTRVARRVRKLVTDFRYYAALLAKDKSVSALCRQVGEPAEEVEKKLAEMCRRGYFRGRIDVRNDCLAFDSVPSAYAARCPGCGATTKIFRNGDVCRYCGNALMIGGASPAENEAPESGGNA